MKANVCQADCKDRLVSMLGLEHLCRSTRQPCFLPVFSLQEIISQPLSITSLSTTSTRYLQTNHTSSCLHSPLPFLLLHLISWHSHPWNHCPPCAPFQLNLPLVSPLHSVPIKLLLSWTTILPCSCYLSYMMSYHMLTQPFVHLLNLSSLTLTHAAQQCYTGGEHQ